MCINISKVLFFYFYKIYKNNGNIIYGIYFYINVLEIFIWYKILKKNGLYVGNGKVMWFKCLGYFFCFML